MAGGNVMILIRGRLNGSGELLDAGIAVRPKTEAPQLHSVDAAGTEPAEDGPLLGVGTGLRPMGAACDGVQIAHPTVFSPPRA